MSDSSCLLFIYFLRQKGSKQLGEQWPVFRKFLQESLQQRGILRNQGKELLFFSYPHPHVALGAVFDILEEARKKIGQTAEFPVLIVLHPDREDNELLSLQDPASTIWDGLRAEAVYISRALKLRWENLMARKELPPHSFVSAGMNGLHELQLADRAALMTKRLFPCRELPILGSHKECFYCSARDHKPASCPSKLLAMEHRGFKETGYQPLPELAANFQEAYTQRAAMIELIAAGITSAQIREDLRLQAFLVFYDIYTIYQQRFLRLMAFSSCTGWHEVKHGAEIEIDSRNLDLGLDCLRVGQYGKIEEFLEEGRMRRERKLFYARVALAFRALELDRTKDMGTLLESAVALASLEKERVYIHLLLIRYYAWQGDLWKAEQTSDQIATLFGDQPEVGYARGQLLVRQGFFERAHQQLQKVSHRHRFYFLATLIDPALLPIQGLVDSMLAAQVEEIHHNAREDLSDAEKICEELKLWLDEEDGDLKTSLKAMDRIRTRYQKGSFFDLFDAIQGARSLITDCQRLLNEKSDWLAGELDKLAAKHSGYYRFWQDYPLKQPFTRFLNHLMLAHRKLEASRVMLENGEGVSYRKAVALHREAGELLAHLQPLLTRMIWIKEGWKGLRVFVKRLLLAEIVVGAMSLVLIFGMPFLLAGAGQEGVMIKLLGQPGFIRQTLAIGIIFIAPALALALTLRDSRKD